MLLEFFGTSGLCYTGRRKKRRRHGFWKFRHDRLQQSVRSKLLQIQRGDVEIISSQILANIPLELLHGFPPREYPRIIDRKQAYKMVVDNAFGKNFHQSKSG